MKNTKALNYALMCLAICVYSFGCKKTVDANLELIFPVMSIENSCCITFEWTSSSLESKLLIAADANFENLILDTLLTTRSFTLNQILTPNKQYFWKVESGLLIESTTFNTKDIIGELEGTYPVVATKYCWPEIFGTCDTTYQTTVEIIKTDDEVQIKEPSSNMDKILHFEESYNTSDEVVYLFYSAGIGNTAKVRINIENDSFFINNRSGGLGGGTIWNFKGKKE